MLSDESDDSDKEESDKLGSKSGSYGTYSTIFGVFLCGLGFPLFFTLSADESCNGDRVSTLLPYKNIGEECTGECTSDANTFSIVRI